MSPNLALIVVAGALVAIGLYLMMERSLTRILVGVVLAGNGVNILFLVAAGPAGRAPFITGGSGDDIADPLPQAMVLTAVVITLGTTAFLLTMAYRSFQLEGGDEVADDVEDRLIMELAESDDVSDSYDEADLSMPSEDDSEPAPEEERTRDPDESADDDLATTGAGGREQA